MSTDEAAAEALKAAFAKAAKTAKPDEAKKAKEPEVAGSVYLGHIGEPAVEGKDFK